ncbi:MAG: hypothetical protein E6G48_00710 [Actinobacteria bacterium]|nr:MAG: hypothetical protein E6G48_00710 [Actinomycetota bacterium]
MLAPPPRRPDPRRAPGPLHACLEGRGPHRARRVPSSGPPRTPSGALPRAHTLRPEAMFAATGTSSASPAQ